MLLKHTFIKTSGCFDKKNKNGCIVANLITKYIVIIYKKNSNLKVDKGEPDILSVRSCVLECLDQYQPMI